MRELTIDWDDLALAFEMNASEQHAYLDTNTGKVVVISEEARRRAEDDDLDSVPAWMREEVEVARQVEADDGKRYIAIPEPDPHDDYEVMRDFIRTVACRRRLAHRRRCGPHAFAECHRQRVPSLRSVRRCRCREQRPIDRVDHRQVAVGDEPWRARAGHRSDRYAGAGAQLRSMTARFAGRTRSRMFGVAVLHVACAPVATFGPQSPMGIGSDLQVGAQLVGGIPLATPEHCGEINQDDPDFTRDMAPNTCRGLGEATFWFARRFGAVDFVPVLALGNVSPVYLSGGLAARLRIVDSEDLLVGIEGQVGWLWAALGVPLSAAVGDNVWIFASPSIGYRAANVLQLPVGAGLQVSERWSVTAEVIGILNPRWTLGRPLPHSMVAAAVGVAWHGSDAEATAVSR